MKHSMVLLSTLLILISGFVNASDRQPVNPLLGSWKMHEVHYISADKTHKIEKPEPGIFLFTENSYAIMWTPTREPRQAFKVLSKPTEEEMIAGFKSVVFNGGSYQFTTSTVTTTAYIAKVPGFEGGLQFYQYFIKNDQLTLVMVDETYPDGSKPDWSGKWQTAFILNRVR